MNIREQLEADEERVLSPFAQKSRASKGRARPEPLDDTRPIFQHDRDRIIHSKAFRRLSGKTQVFLAPEGDHYRNRLTHTLEVSQIARTVTRALRLNESLTEAIVMGHDLGHTPFGHAGEKVLARLMPDGFHHVKQSLRVVDVLARQGKGLNLSAEVRDGILKHSKGKGHIISDNPNLMSMTLEGQIVRISDIVAYVNQTWTTPSGDASCRTRRSRRRSCGCWAPRTASAWRAWCTTWCAPRAWKRSGRSA
jgi:dGTPase